MSSQRHQNTGPGCGTDGAPPWPRPCAARAEAASQGRARCGLWQQGLQEEPPCRLLARLLVRRRHAPAHLTHAVTLSYNNRNREALLSEGAWSAAEGAGGDQPTCARLGTVLEKNIVVARTEALLLNAPGQDINRAMSESPQPAAGAPRQTYARPAKLRMDLSAFARSGGGVSTGAQHSKPGK